MRYVTLLAFAPLALFAACTSVPTFSAAPAIADGGVEGGGWPADAADGAPPGDAGSDAPHQWRFSKYYVFVTQERRVPAEFFNGMTGIRAADALCQAAAAGIEPQARWVAFLAEGQKTAAERLSNPPGGFYRRENGGAGVLVFPDIKDPNAVPLVAIYNQLGVPIAAGAGSPEALVWVGAVTPPNRCDEWRSGEAAVFGACGNTAFLDAQWLASGVTQSCNIPARLYCLEQDP